jgi:hypothetical protein
MRDSGEVRKKTLLDRLSSNKGKWGRASALALILVLIGFLLGQAAAADAGVIPGSENDPLVTASWVEAKLNEFSRSLKEQKDLQIPEKHTKQEDDGGPSSPGQPVVIAPAPTYEVIAVAKGQKMLTGSGTECVLRSGRARAVEGPGGGLSDLTAGRTLPANEIIGRDHLILSPREDGRGIVAETDTILLVRGGYKIE